MQQQSNEDTARRENRGWLRNFIEGDTVQLTRRLLVEHMFERKRLYFISIFWMALGAATTSVLALMTKSMVNSVLVAGAQGAVIFLSVGVMVTFIVRGIALYYEQSTLGNIQVSVMASLERRQFASIIRSNFRRLEGKNPAQLANNSLRYARAGTSLITLVSTNIIKNTLTLIGLGAVMFFQDPVLSLLTFLVAPLALVRLSRLSDRIRNLSAQENRLESGIAGGFAEAIQGSAIVKSYQLEDTLDEQMSKAIENKRSRGEELRRIMALANPLMESLGGVLIGAFIIYAGWQTVENGKTPGEFAAFLTAFLLAYQPARRLAGSNLEMQRLLIPISKMYEEMDRDEVEDLALAPDTPPVSDGSVAFENVSFGYRKGTPALSNVSFDIGKGRRAAIVGRSGAGKSTVAKIMLGVLGEYQGTIRIGGEDIARMPLAKLRASIAYVTQQTFLFEGSIHDNIACGRTGASDEDILEAARLAGVMEFADRMEHGLDSPIGSGGAIISGGQAQRISIARALVKHAPVILFDEPTSALDQATEKELDLANIEGLKNKTVITISHRLATIRDHEPVIVLAGGSVVGIGNHESLLRDCPDYQKLFGAGRRQGGKRRRKEETQRSRRRDGV